jgi:hypothetical protein
VGAAKFQLQTFQTASPRVVRFIRGGERRFLRLSTRSEARAWLYCTEDHSVSTIPRSCASKLASVTTALDPS